MRNTRNSIFHWADAPYLGKLRVCDMIAFVNSDDTEGVKL